MFVRTPNLRIVIILLILAVISATFFISNLVPVPSTGKEETRVEYDYWMKSKVMTDHFCNHLAGEIRQANIGERVIDFDLPTGHLHFNMTHYNGGDIVSGSIAHSGMLIPSQK